MAVTIALGDPPIEVQLRKNARARRLTLRIPASGDGAVLTAPRHATQSQMVSFAKRNEAWLRDRMSAREPTRAPELGTTIPFQGVDLRLVPGSGRTVVQKGATLEIPGKPELVSRKLLAFLKVSARDALDQAVQRYASILDVTPGEMRLRDTRSRWGSCSSRGDLMFSWRLIMAPSDVLDYVAAHEVAHLLEMNHSKAFWAHVTHAYPGWESRRDWLRNQGSSLHRFRF